jgi:hypothetical protein
MKFSIERIPSCPILKFWDFDRIIAVGQNRLKIVNLDFFTIIMKFLNDRVPSCPILEILGSRPLAQVTMDSELITILALIPFK